MEVVKTITPPAKIQKTKFSKFGKYPIIDQSQEEISGWTDNENILIKPSGPIVIFGDHTCVVKYIDRLFAQGADGIKILKSNDKLLPKFLYFFLKNMPVRPEGYKRHFSKLRKTRIPLPPIAEQKKIVAWLDALSQKSRELQNFQNETVVDFSPLRQSILAKSFNS